MNPSLATMRSFASYIRRAIALAVLVPAIAGAVFNVVYTLARQREEAVARDQRATDVAASVLQNRLVEMQFRVMELAGVVPITEVAERVESSAAAVSAMVGWLQDNDLFDGVFIDDGSGFVIEASPTDLVAIDIDAVKGVTATLLQQAPDDAPPRIHAIAHLMPSKHPPSVRLAFAAPIVVRADSAIDVHRHAAVVYALINEARLVEHVKPPESIGTSIWLGDQKVAGGDGTETKRHDITLDAMAAVGGVGAIDDLLRVSASFHRDVSIATYVSRFWRENTVFLAIIVLASLFARKISHDIAGPIQALTMQAERVAGGGYSAQNVGSGYVEFATLEGSMNRMATAIEQDIGRRMEIERQLRASEALLNNALHLAGAGSWVIDVVTRRLTCDDNCGRILGLDERAETSHLLTFDDYVTRYVHPDDGEMVRQIIDAACDANGVSLRQDFRHRFRSATGSPGWFAVRFTIERGPEGRVRRLYGVNLDITEHTLHAERLLAAQERYRLLFDLGSDLIQSFDEDGRIGMVNPAWLNTLGYSAVEAVGMTIWDVIAPECHVGFRESLRHLLLNEPSSLVDVSFVAIDGHRILTEGQILMNRDEGAKRGFLLGVFRDVTLQRLREEGLARDRRRLESLVQERTASILRVNAELVRSNSDLTKFASAASHDMQEPLHAVMVSLSLLERRLADGMDAAARELMTHAVEGAQRMKTLIADILEYSRVGTGTARASLVDMGQVVNDVLSTLGESLRTTHAVVTQDSLPTVFADAKQLELVFQNLLSNGVKFRQPNEPPRIHISAERRDGEWVVCVADQGIGIAPEYFSRIFGLFQRLHTRAAIPGTGLGLAICERIVMRHGGRIWVDSEPGQGASFFFTLPIPEGAETLHEVLGGDGVGV